jgi:hypothetical protein
MTSLTVRPRRGAARDLSITTDFFEFLQIAHLALSGRIEPRKERMLATVKVVSPLSAKVVLEEGWNGAIGGISLNADDELRAQKRGLDPSEPSNAIGEHWRSRRLEWNHRAPGPVAAADEAAVVVS